MAFRNFQPEPRSSALGVHVRVHSVGFRVAAAGCQKGRIWSISRAGTSRVLSLDINGVADRNLRATAEALQRLLEHDAVTQVVFTLCAAKPDTRSWATSNIEEAISFLDSSGFATLHAYFPLHFTSAKHYKGGRADTPKSIAQASITWMTRK